MSDNEYTPTMKQIEDGYAHDPESEYRDPVNYGSTVAANRRAFRRALEAHDREVAAKAKAAIIQRLRDTAHSCRPDSTHNAVADWLEREDFGVPVGTEKEGDRG